MRKLLSIFLCTIFIVSLVSEPVSAASFSDRGKGITVSPHSIDEALDLVASIEDSLSSEGTSIAVELKDFALSMEMQLDSMVKSDSSESRIILAQVNDMTRTLIDQSKTFDQKRNQLAARNAHQKQTTPGYQPGNGLTSEQAYTLAVLAVIAWFNSKDYKLSAELLTHAMSNSSLNSRYTPVYGNRVEASTCFWNCRDEYAVYSGDGEFTNSGSTEERDLYYAIHNFKWRRLQNGKIEIYDLYNYDPFDFTWSIQDIAVETMLIAQKIGVITPFYTIIVHD